MRTKDEAQTDEIVLLWRGGLKVRDIAGKMDLTYNKVYSRLKWRGCQVEREPKIKPTEVTTRVYLEQFPQDLWYQFRDLVHHEKVKYAAVRVIKEEVERMRAKVDTR